MRRLARAPSGNRLCTFVTRRRASSLQPASIAATAVCSCTSHTAHVGARARGGLLQAELSGCGAARTSSSSLRRAWQGGAKAVAAAEEGRGSHSTSSSLPAWLLSSSAPHLVTRSTSRSRSSRTCNSRQREVRRGCRAVPTAGGRRLRFALHSWLLAVSSLPSQSPGSSPASGSPGGPQSWGARWCPPRAAALRGAGPPLPAWCSDPADAALLGVIGARVGEEGEPGFVWGASLRAYGSRRTVDLCN